MCVLVSFPPQELYNAPGASYKQYNIRRLCSVGFVYPGHVQEFQVRVVYEVFQVRVGMGTVSSLPELTKVPGMDSNAVPVPLPAPEYFY